MAVVLPLIPANLQAILLEKQRITERYTRLNLFFERLLEEPVVNLHRARVICDILDRIHYRLADINRFLRLLDYN